MKTALVLIALACGGGLYLASREEPRARSAAAAKAPERQKEPIITLGWAGDLTPGSRYGLPGGNGRQQLKGVRRYLKSPDITVVNLEGTLTEAGADKCGGAAGGNCFSFAAPPRYAQGMQWAGVDAVNLANNHSLDMGPRGLLDTRRAVAREAMQVVGLPGDITYLENQGVRVALLGFAPYPWASDLRNLAKARGMIRAASRKADIVWVAMHAGAEGADQGSTPRGEEIAFGERRGNTRRFARQAVKAGADLVTGSGPHVVRGMEWYRGKLIAYSTGNFAGFHNFSLGDTLSESAILTVAVTRAGRPVRARWRSLLLEGPGIPRPDAGSRSAKTANEYSRQDFGRNAALIGKGGKVKHLKRLR